MSINTSYVESPKADATDGVLVGLEQQASATAVSVEETVGQISEEEAKAAGAEEEAKREANAGTAEGELAVNAITQTIGGSTEIAAMISDVASDSYTNPSKQVDMTPIAKKMSGMIGGKTTSFEDMFSSIKKNPMGNINTGPNLTEKCNLASGSLGGQGKSTKSWGVDEETTGALRQTKELAYSCGLANEQVLSQIRAVRAAPQSPGLGGKAPGMNHDLSKGPKFTPPKDADSAGNGEEAWT